MPNASTSSSRSLPAVRGLSIPHSPPTTSPIIPRTTTPTRRRASTGITKRADLDDSKHQRRGGSMRLIGRRRPSPSTSTPTSSCQRQRAREQQSALEATAYSRVMDERAHYAATAVGAGARTGRAPSKATNVAIRSKRQPPPGRYELYTMLQETCRKKGQNPAKAVMEVTDFLKLWRSSTRLSRSDLDQIVSLVVESRDASLAPHHHRRRQGDDNFFYISSSSDEEWDGEDAYSLPSNQTAPISDRSTATTSTTSTTTLESDTDSSTTPTPAPDDDEVEQEEQEEDKEAGEEEEDIDAVREEEPSSGDTPTTTIAIIKPCPMHPRRRSFLRTINPTLIAPSTTTSASPKQPDNLEVRAPKTVVVPPLKIPPRRRSSSSGESCCMRTRESAPTTSLLFPTKKAKGKRKAQGRLPFLNIWM